MDGIDWLLVHDIGGREPNLEKNILNKRQRHVADLNV